MELSADEDQTNDSESSVIVSKPECWDIKQLQYFSEEYLWLYYNTNKLGCTICKKTNLNLTKNHGHIATEWVNGEVYAVGSDIKKNASKLKEENMQAYNFTFSLKSSKNYWQKWSWTFV